MTGVLIREGNLDKQKDMHIERKNHLRTWKVAICKVRREASGETNPAHTLILFLILII